MGHYVNCSCGQKNNLDSYAFGEPRLCVACSTPLPRHPVVLGPYKEDGFRPEAKGLDLDATAAPKAPLTGFESPSAEELIPAAEPQPRAWHDRVPELLPAGKDGEHCTRCQRVLRGDWDRHHRPEGVFCHICATQADGAYKPPPLQARRELLRPDPPKPLPPPKPDDTEKHRKRRELLIFCGVAIAALVAINIFPVEEWMATVFSTSLDENDALYKNWYFLLLGIRCAVDFIGQAIVIYAALYWQKLLYPGGLRENLGPLLFTAFWFMVINAIFSYGFLIGLIGLIPKSLIVSRAFNFGLDNILAFLLALCACGIILIPARAAVFAALNGIVAAIVL